GRTHADVALLARGGPPGLQGAGLGGLRGRAAAGERGDDGRGGPVTAGAAPGTRAAARVDGRGPGDLRPIRYELGYLQWAEGSILFEMGGTRVLAAASFEPRVPRFKVGTGTGWVSAEYSMLPRATEVRSQREVQQ